MRGTLALQGGEEVREPGPLAFNYTFAIGIIFSFLTLIVSLFTKNYLHKKG